MAIPILNHLDLQQVAELKQARIHNATVAGDYDGVTLTQANNGLIILDGSSLKYFYHNGTSGSWQTVGTSSGTMSSFTVSATTDTTATTISDGDDLFFAAGTGITSETTADGTVTTTLNLATSSARGGIQIGYTENGQNYPVELDSEKAYVNVPWTDTNTTYTAGTGLTLNSTEFSVDYAGTDNIIDSATNLEGTAISTGDTIMYHDATDNNVKKGFVSDLPFNNYSHPTHPGDDFSVDTGALTGAVIVSDIDINVTTDTLGHVTDANGTVATRTLTLSDLGYTGDTNANNYSLPLATSSVRGGVKIGYTESGQNYPVELDNEQMYVNVPWTDTTYTLPTASSTTLGGVKVGTNLTIDGNGVLDVGAIALTTVQTASSETAMLNLTTEEGDVVVRTDENKTYMHNGGTAGTMADFTELISPTDGVSSLTTTDGTYINLTPNSAASGAVTVTADLSATDASNTGTSQRFLTKDGTWAVPAYTTNTNTTYTPGDGLDLTGTEFSVDLKANSGLVIDTTELSLNLSATGIAGTLAVSDGGTGATDASGARTNLGVPYATAAQVQGGTSANTVVTPDTLAAKSVVADISAASVNSSNLYAEVTHNLGTADIVVQIYDKTTEATVFADVFRTDKSNAASTSKIKIVFAAVPSNDLRVVITSVEGATSGTVAYS